MAVAVAMIACGCCCGYEWQQGGVHCAAYTVGVRVYSVSVITAWSLLRGYGVVFTAAWSLVVTV